MKKQFLALVLVLCMVAGVLSGCHGSAKTEAFSLPDTFDTSRQYEITFWAKNDTNMTQVGIYKKAIADFQALYPNITVNLRLYTDYGKIYNDVITNITTNTTPNVCITYPDHIATYMTGSNVVVPLDGLFADEKYGLGGSELRFDGPTQDEIIPQFLRECVVSGQHYAIPYMRSTEACYVNKTFVEKLGFTLPETLTWDFVWEVSAAATQKGADGTYLVNGQKVMIPFIYKSTDNMMIQMLRQQNAGYSTQNGQIALFNDTTKEILQDIGESTAIGAFNTFKSIGYPANYLNAGQCIFAIDSTAGATWMGSDAPLIDIAQENVVEFETVIMPIPQYNTANPQMISQGPSMCVFNKEDPQQVLASWLFAQYMLTNEVQIAYAQTEGYVPVTSKARDSEAYQDYMGRGGEDNDFYYELKIQASQLLWDNVENTFTTPVFNGSASLRDSAGQLIEEVRKVSRRGQKIDDAYLEALFAHVTALYRLDQAGGSEGPTGKVSLGVMPLASKLLLVSLGAVWLLMGVYVTAGAVRRKNEKNRKPIDYFIF